MRIAIIIAQRKRTAKRKYLKTEQIYYNRGGKKDILVGFEEFARGALHVLTESVVALSRIARGFEFASRAADAHVLGNVLVLLRNQLKK
jgi:hypothetical protein